MSPFADKNDRLGLCIVPVAPAKNSPVGLESAMRLRLPCAYCTGSDPVSIFRNSLGYAVQLCSSGPKAGRVLAKQVIDSLPSSAGKINRIASRSLSSKQQAALGSW